MLPINMEIYYIKRIARKLGFLLWKNQFECANLEKKNIRIMKEHSTVPNSFANLDEILYSLEQICFLRLHKIVYIHFVGSYYIL